METSEIKFYFPWRVQLSILFIFIWLPILFMAPELTAQVVIPMVINMLLPILGIWYISVLSITASGMRLYRVNKLEWPDITEAKITKFFGLPHVHIKRKKGMPWSIPLYFIGPTTVKQRLIANVPTDNPLFIALNENT